MRVRGEYNEAFRIAEKLEDVAGAVPSSLCRAPLLVMVGRSHQAKQLLDEIQQEAVENFPSVLPWIETVRAEASAALGETDVQRKHFENGLEQEPENLPLLRRYADFLMERGENRKVIKLLIDHIEDTGILLRLTIAARRDADWRFEQWSKSLDDRFAEIRLRGSEPHGRFESRYELQVKDDPQRALTLAKANWERQKEMLDALVFLEAAVAAGDRSSATSVLNFIREHGTKHVMLDPLVKQLEAIR